VVDVELRPVADADLEAVKALCVNALEVDAPENATAYLVTLASRDHLHLVASQNGAIVGTVIGSVRPNPDTSDAGHVDLIAVQPSSQGQGIGRALLSALEDRFRSAGCGQAVIAGNPPSYAFPGIDTRYTRAITLAERMGYAKFNDALNMDVALDRLGDRLATSADEQRLAAAGITVRRLEAGDEASIRPWLDTWGGSWTAEALAGLRYEPVRCHVARAADGQWLGFAAWGVNAPTWFGPMGTEQTERRHGIGSVLLKRCLADQRAAGFTRAEIGWAGPYTFYARSVDAWISRIFWLYRKEL
jgi:mycothiol synthase